MSDHMLFAGLSGHLLFSEYMSTILNDVACASVALTQKKIYTQYRIVFVVLKDGSIAIAATGVKKHISSSYDIWLKQPVDEILYDIPIIVKLISTTGGSSHDTVIRG